MNDASNKKVHSLKVDRDACLTAASCLAYHFYELDDEAKAVILTKNGSNSDNATNPETNEDGLVEVENLPNPKNLTKEEMQELALESAMCCPFNAIIAYDKDGNQIWPEL